MAQKFAVISTVDLETSTPRRARTTTRIPLVSFLRGKEKPDYPEKLALLIHSIRTHPVSQVSAGFTTLNSLASTATTFHSFTDPNALLNDSTASEHHGTLLGPASAVSSPEAGVLSLSGASIDLSAHAADYQSPEFTQSFWFQTTQAPSPLFSIFEPVRAYPNHTYLQLNPSIIGEDSTGGLNLTYVAGTVNPITQLVHDGRHCWGNTQAIDGAARFPENSYLHANKQADALFTENFTLSFWMWVNYTASGDEAILHCKDSTASGIWFQDRFILSYKATGVLRLTLADEVETVVDLRSSAAIPSSTWTHVAVVISSGFKEIYINGSAGSIFDTGSSSTPYNMQATLANESLVTFFANRNFGGNDPASAYRGYLSEVQFFSTVLSPSEINMVRGASAPPALANSYKIALAASGALTANIVVNGTPTNFTSTVTGLNDNEFHHVLISLGTSGRTVKLDDMVIHNTANTDSIDALTLTNPRMLLGGDENYLTPYSGNFSTHTVFTGASASALSDEDHTVLYSENADEGLRDANIQAESVDLTVSSSAFYKPVNTLCPGEYLLGSYNSPFNKETLLAPNNMLIPMRYLSDNTEIIFRFRDSTAPDKLIEETNTDFVCPRVSLQCCIVNTSSGK